MELIVVDSNRTKGFHTNKDNFIGWMTLILDSMNMEEVDKVVLFNYVDDLHVDNKPALKIILKDKHHNDILTKVYYGD